MHELDIRRALDRPRGYDGPVAAHVIGVFGRALPMVVGRRVAPASGTCVRLLVPDAGRDWAVRLGEDGRAGFVDPDDASPDVTVSLSAEDYVVLSGGRRPVTATDARVEGDRELGARVLGSLAVTP
ncbi:MAG: SCP2 sterol-binding domain-containing protein [Marmoricola sp.]|nr:SCP2 sterol-binding domain-containing protein [Marmoricola sp.]